MIDEIAAMKTLDMGITCAVETLVTAMGMMAANQMRFHRNESPAYVEEDFQSLIEANGTCYSAVVGKWNNLEY